MRLRLCIERNELPPTKVVHTISSTQLEQTVSQFLQSINSLFPLESTNWDISDYAVLIDGYEATHYTQVGQAFKDEDEVVIKPLGFAELRARTLTGRDQISEDGRHLLDGIPFGRPLLKRPRRPEVKIPARKRQRMGAEAVQAVVRFEDEDDDEDDEDDGDSEDAEEVGSREEDDAAEESSDSEDSEDESDSSDGNSSSEESSDSSDSSDSESADEIGSEAKVIADFAPAKSAKLVSSKSALPPQKLPHQGDARTKERNNRRRDSKKLKHLKDAGVLPQTATLQDMHAYQQGKGLDNDGLFAATQRATMEKERKRLLDQIATGGIEIANKKSAPEDDDEGPPDVLSSRPSGTSPEASTETISDAASTQIMAEVQQAATAASTQSPVTPGGEVEACQTSASKRARLDTKSMNRLVFGSLGLRTPKTAEERDALQKKLTARPKRAVPVVAPAKEPVAGEDEDPDSWREKIVLNAVECVDEDVTLCTPPFPFHQRWDPQYQISRKRKRARGKQADAGTHGAFTETYDKYNQDGGGDALNYDDPEEGEEGDDSYWEDGALLDNNGHEAEEADLFPQLPDDLSSLASLAETDAKVGDFITYQELSVSAATGWEPKIVTQVAHVEATNEDGTWTILLKQDKPKQYDEDGNRVYRKFEMENFSDDGSGEDTKTVVYGELQSPRLLLRPIFDKAAS